MSRSGKSSAWIGIALATLLAGGATYAGSAAPVPGAAVPSALPWWAWPAILFAVTLAIVPAVESAEERPSALLPGPPLAEARLALIEEFKKVAPPLASRYEARRHESETGEVMPYRLFRPRIEPGRRYPLVVGGRELRTAAELASVNPAHPEQVIGICASAGPAEGALSLSYSSTEKSRLQAPVTAPNPSMVAAAESRDREGQAMGG